MFVTPSPKCDVYSCTFILKSSRKRFQPILVLRNQSTSFHLWQKRIVTALLKPQKKTEKKRRLQACKRRLHCMDPAVTAILSEFDGTWKKTKEQHWRLCSLGKIFFFLPFFISKETFIHIFFFLALFSPTFLRTEPSSTWRASTTRRWSTTPFWPTADIHTLTRTRTRSITATPGGAERGTASQSASVDRNHSSSHHFSFLSSPAARPRPSIRHRGWWAGGQTGQRPAVFTRCGAAATWNNSRHLRFFLKLSLRFLRLFFFFYIFVQLQYYVTPQYSFSSSPFQVSSCSVLFLSEVVMSSPRSRDLVLNRSAKLLTVQRLFFFSLFHFVQ